MTAHSITSLNWQASVQWGVKHNLLAYPKPEITYGVRQGLISFPAEAISAEQMDPRTGKRTQTKEEKQRIRQRAIDALWDGTGWKPKSQRTPEEQMHFNRLTNLRRRLEEKGIDTSGMNLPPRIRERKTKSHANHNQ